MLGTRLTIASTSTFFSTPMEGSKYGTSRKSNTWLSFVTERSRLVGIAANKYLQLMSRCAGGEQPQLLGERHPHSLDLQRRCNHDRRGWLYQRWRRGHERLPGILGSHICR